jgi:hypothetical protein
MKLRFSRFIRSEHATRAFVAGLALSASAFIGAGAQTPAPLAPHRARLLGVFNAQTGDPIEGAEVIDLLSKTKALTTATGTVTLSFLPEGGSMIRVTKIGFSPETNVVPITPVDTTPFMIMLRPLAQSLPTVVTKDTAAPLSSPGLREFDERRRQGAGHFITTEELRKNETKNMTYMVRRLPGVQIDCPRGASHQPECFAYSGRQGSKSAFRGGRCDMDVYIDGTAVSPPVNLNDFRVDTFAGVEFYSGAASTPAKYNKTGSACGVLLFWTRVR